MSLEAKDLRIGNYLQDYNERLVIVSKYTFINLKEYQSNQNTALIPIPLTEEWLIKFGFEKFKNRWYLNAFEVHQVKDKFCVMVGGIENWFEYVHQLQNAYALTGNELEIKK